MSENLRKSSLTEKDYDCFSKAIYGLSGLVKLINVPDVCGAHLGLAREELLALIRPIERELTDIFCNCEPMDEGPGGREDGA